MSVSMNESHPGRGLGSALRSLFRSSSGSASSSPRRRVSKALRRSLTVFSSKHPEGEEQPARAHGSPSSSSDPEPVPNPMDMLGLDETSQSAAGADSLDIFEWYPHYENCQRYFLDHAQHSKPIQALSAYVNIHLPFQRHPPILNATSGENGTTASTTPAVSLIPYIRRLVATGMDFPGVLHGFFGDDWQSGVGPSHEKERRNYLFAAKSGSWARTKMQYDMPPSETIPFLRPLQGALEPEIQAANRSWHDWLLMSERSWREWLAMEDWRIGPRTPATLYDGRYYLNTLDQGSHLDGDNNNMEDTHFVPSESD